MIPPYLTNSPIVFLKWCAGVGRTFSMSHVGSCLSIALVQIVMQSPSALAIDLGEGECPPAINRLAAAFSGGGRLPLDGQWGYLPAVLERLEVSPDSQTLVFSKTSFQTQQIWPDQPRAIYFNDDYYVAWVRGSETIEFAVADRERGARFFMLKPSPEQEAGGQAARPVLIENTTRCVGCHKNAGTLGVPGFLMRSVVCSPQGRFVRGAPTYATDHTSPFPERWGGWYVTGSHGQARHLGNVVCYDPRNPDWVDREAGANQQHLPNAITSEAYLRPTSDIFALMVLAHETQMHNHITRLSFAARQLDAPADESQPADAAILVAAAASQKRFSRVVAEFMRYLLFADEPPLASPISSDSPYRSTFENRGPRDQQGRSLRQIDGSRYLFKYPCSFLIYGDTFAALPDRAKLAVGKRLRAILLEPVEKMDAWPRPSPAERVALVEILTDTLPDFWQRYVEGPEVMQDERPEKSLSAAALNAADRG